MACPRATCARLLDLSAVSATAPGGISAIRTLYAATDPTLVTVSLNRTRRES
jgi:hypothetical protein